MTTLIDVKIFWWLLILLSMAKICIGYCKKSQGNCIQVLHTSWMLLSYVNVKTFGERHPNTFHQH